MDKLLELLGQELFDQVKSKLGDKVVFVHGPEEKVIVDDGKSFIPKSRFDEVNNQKKDLETQVAERDKNISDLKKAAKGNEELTKQIEDLQAQNKKASEDYEVRNKELTKSLALKEALFNSGVTDEDSRDLLTNKFDLKNIELDESGKVKNFDTLVKPYKEHQTLKALFNIPTPKGSGAVKPDGKTSFYTREELNNLSASEVDANFEAVQASYEQLGKTTT